MISIEIREMDLNELTKTKVQNLPGTLFAGTSPLLKPFMKKLEALLPPENKGRGESYTLFALHSHIDEVHAGESMIHVKRGGDAVEIRREELIELISERYPTTDLNRLNLPGLLFLQSSPGLQAASVITLRRKHKLRIPDGHRTMRYIFHTGVIAMDADKEKVIVKFDQGRLPRKADGSCVLE
jgi:hypothetical protein